MKKFVFSFLFTVLLLPFVYGTHNRAGEITYVKLSAYTYKVIVTTYTKESSQADRCYIEVFWGDGSNDTIPRINGSPFNGCNAYGIMVGTDIKQNIYEAIHTYSSNGCFTIAMEDPNRNEDINNIPNSVNTSFYLESQICILPGLGSNNSVQLFNMPIDNACVNQPFLHNPGAWDPDETDSISYTLVPGMANGIPIPGWSLPAGVTLDEITGDLLWDVPTQIGEFNIAILIEEWRFGFKVGSVLRDMQITVQPCSNNPPVIAPIPDICVKADSLLELAITATDPDGDQVTLSALGEPFIISNSPATFPTVSGSGFVSGTFTWQINCSHVRKKSYQVFLRAVDNATVDLVDLQTMNITVIAPPPENPVALPVGNTIQLSWDPSYCTEATGYLIYRREGFYGYVPGTCETGVPAYTGYQLIGSTSGLNNTSYIDGNSGQDLVHGVDYCYMIVATFADGAESCASVEFCAELKKDVPILTHVDILATSPTNGKIDVKWTKPTEFDTIQFPGPYKYLIRRSPNFTGAPLTLIDSLASLNDTTYTDSLINTVDNPYSYRIDFYNDSPGNRVFIGSTHVGSSVYLSIVETDNQLDLTWQEVVPWNNYSYEVYRDNGGTWSLLATTLLPEYTDYNLSNGQTYCYFVRSIGEYTGTGTPKPLLNNSQELCGVPLDSVAPCNPTLTVFPDCENFENGLIWNNPNNSCADDVMMYHIWYSPVLDGEMKIIATINAATDTVIVFSELSSIAGCYGVTAIDSFQNEGIMDTVCVDNCPKYELPNVFTPDGDNLNDYLIPFPYKFIESIDLEIYNRWGAIVFDTTKPEIRWDGKHKDSKQMCSAGVYYYVCKVNEIRLEGLIQREIKGFVHLIYD